MLESSCEQAELCLLTEGWRASVYC